MKPLTPCLEAVMEKLAAGKTLKAAARDLKVCYGTAARRVHDAKIILGAQTTAEAVLFYVQRKGG